MPDGRAATNGASTAPAHLRVEDLTVAYNGRPVLCDVTFEVPEGTRVAVVGPNGAGKSTLFKAMVGLLTPRGGRVLVHGVPYGQHQDCVAYVPQRGEVDWRFPVTVSDVVMMGRYGRVGWLGRPRQADREAVRRALDEMSIAHLADRPIGELSGGQQQRVFLARALAQEPHILLMDEPFTGIDVTTQNATLELMDRLQAQKVTALVATHDLTLATERFDLALLLNHEVIAFGPAASAFTAPALARAFGGQVLFLEGRVAVVDQCCPGEHEHEHVHEHAPAASEGEVP